MKYLLDTDHISFLFRRNSTECPRIEGNIHRVGQHEVAFSIVSFHEQVMGFHKQLSRAKRPADLVMWYGGMGRLFSVYGRTNLVLFEGAAASTLAAIKKLPKLQIDPMDLRIAAIALAGGMTLVSRNLADFGRVPNLAVENWTR